MRPRSFRNIRPILIRHQLEQPAAADQVAGDAENQPEVTTRELTAAELLTAKMEAAYAAGELVVQQAPLTLREQFELRLGDLLIHHDQMRIKTAPIPGAQRMLTDRISLLKQTYMALVANPDELNREGYLTTITPDLQRCLVGAFTALQAYHQSKGESDSRGDYGDVKAAVESLYQEARPLTIEWQPEQEAPQHVAAQA